MQGAGGSWAEAELSWAVATLGGEEQDFREDLIYECVSMWVHRESRRIKQKQHRQVSQRAMLAIDTVLNPVEYTQTL